MGKEWKQCQTFIFWVSKIAADGDFSHEIKRCFILERKAMKNLDSILKSRDTTLPTKVHLFKAMVFPVLMYGCENWTIKKAEYQTIQSGPHTQTEGRFTNGAEMKHSRTDAEAPGLWPPDW